MVDDDNELASGFWSAVGFTTDESTDRRWASAGLTIYVVSRRKVQIASSGVCSAFSIRLHERV